MTAPLLDLANVHKAFGPVQALSGASLQLFPGEIHALLGENGAGKSTLVSIAAGRLPLDSGEIRLAGAPLRLRSAREARARGIALVPQHDLLVPAATVAENLALLDPHARFFESARFRRERVRRAEERFGLSLGDPDVRVDGLPVGQRQRLEIAGALLDDPAVLILDEPTAVLSPDETDALFAALRARVSLGKVVLLITHRIAEVFQAADRLTLLSKGRVILTTEVASTTPAEVGSRLVDAAGGVLFGEGLTPVVAGARAALTVTGPSFNVTIPEGGQAVLLAIDGNGADTLAASVAGLSPATGRVRVGETDIAIDSPRAFRAAGGAFVPADRRAEGLFPNLTLDENLAVRARLPEGGAADLLQRFGVRPADPSLPARALSGGNQQKLLLAREIAGSPRVLIAIHPTRGLDPAAAASIRERLLDARTGGAGVLVVTSDPEEALALGGARGSALHVVYRGNVSAPLPPDTPVETLARLMGGLAA